MKKSSNERLNMMLAIMLIVNASQLVWQNLAAFVDAFAKFTNLVADAQDSNNVAQKKITGFAKGKKQDRESMADQAMLVKGAVQAYANASSNPELFHSVDFSRSDVVYGKSSIGLSRCQVIKDVASGILVNLQDFGVTQPTLDELKARMQNYQLSISAPANAKAERTTMNENLIKFLDQADDVLKNEMDKLMENFRLTAPSFYAQYFHDRKLIHGATNFTEITATIINAQTKQPVQGATMTITSPTKTYTVVSGGDGIADKKSMEPAWYEVTISKPGFLSQTTNVLHITRSEKEGLTFELVPVV